MNWEAVSAIGQVAGALATFIAVVVALKLAREERSIRLRVTAGFRAIVSDRDPLDVVAVTVENIGHRTATIENLFWSTGYVRRWFPLPKTLKLQSCLQIQDYDWSMNERFPWTLEPGKMKATFFRREQFIEQFSKASNGDLFRKLPLTARWILLNYRVGVSVTTLTKVCDGRVEPSMKAALEASYQRNK